MEKYDVIIIGAGASGVFAAIYATQMNKRVAVIDMGKQPLRKVFVSGGGRCNFTNTQANPDRYFGQNPHFVRSALSQFSPKNMLEWMDAHNINYAQKSPGQYFCATGATDIINALINDAHNADFFMNQYVQSVTKTNNLFSVQTQANTLCSSSLIIATGGISYSNLGTSDIGMRIAKQFGHKIIPIRPGLCAISCHVFPTELAGISLNASVSGDGFQINDDMIITHFGIGGPAIYRASIRNIKDGLHINMTPKINIHNIIMQERQINGRRNISTVLSRYLPIRLSRWIGHKYDKNIADLTSSDIKQIVSDVSDIFIPENDIKLHPIQSAEVMYGGVSTDSISSKTLESKLCQGLFFAGEVLDITGDLGGFNLQWAWSSGFVAGNNA